jgi:hypothetical protein
MIVSYRCIATCVRKTEVTEYHIKKETIEPRTFFGYKGEATVTCEWNSFVLGCGIEPSNFLSNSNLLEN